MIKLKISKLDLIKKIMEVKGDSVDLDSLIYGMKEDLAKDSSFEELESKNDLKYKSNQLGDDTTPLTEVPEEPLAKLNDISRKTEDTLKTSNLFTTREFPESDSVIEKREDYDCVLTGRMTYKQFLEKHSDVYEFKQKRMLVQRMLGLGSASKNRKALYFNNIRNMASSRRDTTEPYAIKAFELADKYISGFKDATSTYERLECILCFLYTELSEEFNNGDSVRRSNISVYLRDSTIWRALAYALFRSDKKNEIFTGTLPGPTWYHRYINSKDYKTYSSNLVPLILDSILLVLKEFKDKEVYSLINLTFKEDFKLHKLNRMRYKIEQVSFGNYPDEFKTRSLLSHKRNFKRLTGIEIDPNLPLTEFEDIIDKELHVISSEATKIRGEYRNDKPNYGIE